MGRLSEYQPYVDTADAVAQPREVFVTYVVGPAGQLLADKPLSTGRLSEYPTDYFVGICIETSAVAEQNTPWLPRVNFSDRSEERRVGKESRAWCTRDRESRNTHIVC